MDALDRMLIGEALAHLSAQDRAVIRRSYYQGLHDRADRRRSPDRRRRREVETALRRASATAHIAGHGGDM